MTGSALQALLHELANVWQSAFTAFKTPAWEATLTQMVGP